MGPSSSKNKTLLIVSGGIEAADAAKRAKEMGLYVPLPSAMRASCGRSMA